ncbi:transposable element Tcb2 transposase [Trichonephila clavipes]|nr:transposable element Tcb2 transposase [Trichonephila clavipes]
MRRYAGRRNGECLSSIKHVVGTTSGCFYPRSNHWEVGGRPHCDKCGCRVRNYSQHRFTTLETISNYRNSYPGFSSGRPRGTTPADDRYIVLQARRNRRQTAGEIARHTTQATGRPISRFTVARRLHGGGLFARRPVRCVPLTLAHRRRRSLWCREHRNWRDNEWGRVLFTDESRFSLSSDSHRILIWREWGSRNHPSNIIERDRYGGRGVLVWGGIMLGSRTDLHIFDAGSVNGARYCNEILLPYVRLFRGAMGLQFLFMDDNAPCHRTVAVEQLLESEDIERMDWPARSPDLNPIEHVWDFLGRRLAARTLPPVTIRELRLALQDEWAAMPQQLIDTLILSRGRRCETCLARDTDAAQLQSYIHAKGATELDYNLKLGELKLLFPCPVKNCNHNTTNGLNATRHKKRAAESCILPASFNPYSKETNSTSKKTKTNDKDTCNNTAEISNRKELPENTIPVNNPFSVLTIDDNDMEVAGSAENNDIAQPKVKPIMLKFNKNFNLILKHLNRKYPDSVNKLTGEYIKITAANIDQHGEITNELKEKGLRSSQPRR